ncbi:MAG: anti-sigma factor family protein [Candidatus Scalinduaceae bacterium]
MNCNNVRKYFYAFIDNELDVEKNVEVLAHLDMCYECSHKIERERLLQKRVKETVCTVKAPDYLEHMILKKTERKPNFFTLLRSNLMLRNNLIPLGAIAITIILIVSIFVIQSNLKKNDVLYLAESKFHNHITKPFEPDIRSQDNEVIMEYFQSKTNLNITLPGIEEGTQLVGASLSEINNAKVPMVFYMQENNLIALFIVCNTDPLSGYGANIDFTKMKEVIVDKMVVYKDNGFCNSCQVIGWKDVGNQYVMISKLNSDKMIKMLTEV